MHEVSNLVPAPTRLLREVVKFSTERRAEAGTEYDLLNFTPRLSQNGVTNARTFLRFCAIVCKSRCINKKNTDETA